MLIFQLTSSSEIYVPTMGLFKIKTTLLILCPVIFHFLRTTASMQKQIKIQYLNWKLQRLFKTQRRIEQLKSWLTGGPNTTMSSNISTEFSQIRRNVMKVKSLTNLSQFIIHISYFSFSIDLQ